MFDKITNFGENCVTSAPDILNGTAQQNKEWFDKSVKNVVATAFNALIDALGESDAAEQIGTTEGKLQDVLANLKNDVADVNAGVVTNKDALATKVDKEEGKGLSEENFTKGEREKLGGIEDGAQVNAIEGIQINVGAVEKNGKTVNLKIPTPQEIIEDNNLVDNQKLSAELEKKVSKDGNKVLSDNNYTTAEKKKLAGVEEGAQVNKIEGISYNGTQLPIENKNVNIDTYRGMRKMTQTVLSAENTSISLNLPVTRGYALLTWPSEQRDISGKPIGYIIDANGTSQPVTAYQNGIGKYVTGYYMIDFEIFSQVAKVSSYAVYSHDGAESAVVVSDKVVNTGGIAQGIKFFFSGKFPEGTKLELWGE